MKNIKIIRSKLKAILRSNKFKFKKQMKLDDINILKSSNLDSLQVLSIISEIEKVFKIKFSSNFFNKKSSSLKNVIDIILKKR
jgi:acyl carrier protein